MTSSSVAYISDSMVSWAEESSEEESTPSSAAVVLGNVDARAVGGGPSITSPGASVWCPENRTVNECPCSVV